MTSKIGIFKVQNIHGDKSTGTDAEGNILCLQHPKSDVSTSYVLKDGVLQELHWFKQSNGSWFLGDYVCEDGSLYISTPVDPIFIFLPIFADARMKKGNDLGMFRQLDEILYVEGYPGYKHLMAVAEKSMQLVCEMKEIGTSKFFRLNDAKVLSWLCCKVLHLKASLLKLDKNYACQDEKETLKEVVSILGEYLKDEPWLNQLCGHLKLGLQEVLQRAPKNEPGQGSVENTPEISLLREVGPGKNKPSSSNKMKSKKLKTETDSQNIKDMFRRASTRRR